MKAQMRYLVLSILLALAFGQAVLSQEVEPIPAEQEIPNAENDKPIANPTQTADAASKEVTPPMPNSGHDNVGQSLIPGLHLTPASLSLIGWLFPTLTSLLLMSNGLPHGLLGSAQQADQEPAGSKVVLVLADDKDPAGFRGAESILSPRFIRQAGDNNNPNDFFASMLQSVAAATAQATGQAQPGQVGQAGPGQQTPGDILSQAWNGQFNPFMPNGPNPSQLLSQAMDAISSPQAGQMLSQAMETIRNPNPGQLVQQAFDNINSQHPGEIVSQAIESIQSQNPGQILSQAISNLQQQNTSNILQQAFDGFQGQTNPAQFLQQALDTLQQNNPAQALQQAMDQNLAQFLPNVADLQQTLLQQTQNPLAPVTQTFQRIQQQLSQLPNLVGQIAGGITGGNSGSDSAVGAAPDMPDGEVPPNSQFPNFQEAFNSGTAILGQALNQASAAGNIFRSLQPFPQPLAPVDNNNNPIEAQAQSQAQAQAQASEISEVRVRPAPRDRMNEMKIKSALQEALAQKSVPLLWFRLPAQQAAPQDTQQANNEKTMEDLQIEEQLKAFERQVIAELRQLQEIERQAKEMRAAAKGLTAKTQKETAYKFSSSLSKTPIHKITREDVERVLNDEYVKKLLQKSVQSYAKDSGKHGEAFTQYLTAMAGIPMKRQAMNNDPSVTLQQMSKDEIINMLAYAYRMAAANGQDNIFPREGMNNKDSKGYVAYRANAENTKNAENMQQNVAQGQQSTAAEMQRQWIEQQQQQMSTQRQSAEQEQKMQMQQRQWIEQNMERARQQAQNMQQSTQTTQTQGQTDADAEFRQWIEQRIAAMQQRQSANPEAQTTQHQAQNQQARQQVEQSAQQQQQARQVEGTLQQQQQTNPTVGQNVAQQQTPAVVTATNGAQAAEDTQKARHKDLFDDFDLFDIGGGGKKNGKKNKQQPVINYYYNQAPVRAPAYGGYSAPSYGAPAVSGYGAPAAPVSSYGSQSAPIRNFGAPSGGYGAPAVGGYGAPAAPVSNYGAPSAPIRNFGAPSGGYGAPTASVGGYGAPAASVGGYGASAAPNKNFGSPVASGGYGAPAAAGSYGGRIGGGSGAGSFGGSFGGGHAGGAGGAGSFSGYRAAVGDQEIEAMLREHNTWGTLTPEVIAAHPDQNNQQPKPNPDNMPLSTTTTANNPQSTKSTTTTSDASTSTSSLSLTSSSNASETVGSLFSYKSKILEPYMGLKPLESPDDPWNHKAYDLHQPLYTGGASYESFLQEGRFKRDTGSYNYGNSLFMPGILDQLLKFRSLFQKNFPYLYRALQERIRSGNRMRISIKPPLIAGEDDDYASHSVEDFTDLF